MTPGTSPCQMPNVCSVSSMRRSCPSSLIRHSSTASATDELIEKRTPPFSGWAPRGNGWLGWTCTGADTDIRLLDRLWRIENWRPLDVIRVSAGIRRDYSGCEGLLSNSGHAGELQAEREHIGFLY